MLVVGPGHGLDRHSQRNEFINLFLSAKESIEIYIQSYNDEEIAQVLEKICHEGKVKVRLLKDFQTVFNPALYGTWEEIQDSIVA